MGAYDPQRLGDFELLRELGRGGMGIVYEARQVSLNRKVALKVLSGGLGLTSKAVQRFRREAEAAAKLHHTNIVPIYATGEEDGTHFYAMELIDGPSLDHVIRQMRDKKSVVGTENPEVPSQRPRADATLAATVAHTDSSPSNSGASSLTSSSLSSASNYFDTVARMIAEVADALGYAHKNGVIHRDIKPSNLLPSPDGRLSINDFGLARVLEQPGMTVSGEFVGTPAYMSPEQITAGRIPLDHRTDIYSLGATLYELLTLERPHTGQSREQVLAQIVHKEPRAPRRISKKVPVDLETICLKALEKDPDRRYQTAGQMADDLRRYLNRFTISARRRGPVGRLVKWVRRRPAVAVLLACVVIAVGVAAASLYRTYRAEQHLLAEKRQVVVDRASLAAMGGQFEEAEEAIREAERLGASTGQVRLLRGQVALHAGNADEAVAHLEQAVELLPQSVTARAMLASAYEGVLQWSKANQTLRELERLTPVSPDDHLYKGYAIALFDPREGLKSIDDAIRLRSSAVARLLRSIVRAKVAEDSANPADAERAVQDAERAKEDLSGNPLALRTSVAAYLTAATAYEATKQDNRRKVALAQARADAEGLKAFVRLRQATGMRWRFFAYVGEEDAVAEEMRHTSELTGDRVILGWYAAELYRQGKPKEVLAVLGGPRGSIVPDFIRCYALMEGPGGEAKALEAWKEMAGSLHGWQWLYGQTVLRFIRADAAASAATRAFRSQPDRFDVVNRVSFERMLTYSAGEIGPEVLLEGTAGSRRSLCRAHYFIALTKLCGGDRPGARVHLELAVATRAFSMWTWDMSRLLLARLEKDKAWPPWIPLKVDGTKL
jgi:serine/threonine protein kinase